MTLATTLDSGSRTGWADEARATLSLSWPLVLTNLAQMAIMTTDLVMMGWLGPTAIAAGTLGTNLFFATFMFAMGLAAAAAPLAAQALGRKVRAVREVRGAVAAALWLVTAYAVLAGAVLWNGAAILRAMGQEDHLADLAGDYLRALLWGVAPALWFLVIRSFLSAVERPRAALVVTVAAILLNAFVNWVLMFGNLGAPALGVVGAGIASALSNLFMAVGLFAFVTVDRRLRRFNLLGRPRAPETRRMGEVVRIGVPIGVTMALEGAVFNASAFIMGAFGEAALAAHAVALQLAAIAFMVPMGIAQAATVRVGLAAGRGDPDGIGRAGRIAYVLGLGFMATTAIAFLLVPRAIIGLFIDVADPANATAVTLAVTFLALAGVFQLADGAQVLGAGALRGLKDTTVPMVFAAIGYWVVGLPVGVLLAFPLGAGAPGLWVGLAAGLAVVAVLMAVRWARRATLGLVPAVSGPPGPR
jgi:MATE family multidrug resistance protein